MTIIRVELGEEASGKWRWCATVRGHAVEGRSREPLLGACRLLKSLGCDPAAQIGLFRAGRNEPDLFCTIAGGAKLTVMENDRGGPRFVRWKPYGGVQ